MDQKSQQVIRQDSNYVAAGVAELLYQNQLRAIEETLKRFHVPARYYTILGAPKEDSLCMAFADGEWVTFTFERGNETNRNVYSALDDAVFEMLEAMSDDEVELQQMKTYYEELVRRSGKVQITSPVLFQTILKRMETISAAIL